jgi:biotin carboxyl carrier protein
VAVLEPDGRRVTWSIVEAGPERVRAIRSAAAGRVGEATAREATDGEATAEPTRIAALLGPVRREADGRAIREVVVDGWRFGVEVEGARRAIVRERARRAGGAAHHGGPTEVRAAIPGRVVAVAVAEGDAVVVGSDLLVVEAMKMQNEVRSPRDGVVRRVAVGVGQSLELGDLLVVIE